MGGPVTEAPVGARLLNGARLLGQLFRSGVRCNLGGWSMGCCPNPTKFCQAKTQWMRLAEKAGREIEMTDWGVIEAMTFSEFSATGLTMKVDLGEIGVVGVGSRSEIPIADFLLIAQNPESMKSVLKVLRSFPGSKVTGIEDPPKQEATKKTG